MIIHSVTIVGSWWATKARLAFDMRKFLTLVPGLHKSARTQQPYEISCFRTNSRESCGNSRVCFARSAKRATKIRPETTGYVPGACSNFDMMVFLTILSAKIVSILHREIFNKTVKIDLVGLFRAYSWACVIEALIKAEDLAGPFISGFPPLDS